MCEWGRDRRLLAVVGGFCRWFILCAIVAFFSPFFDFVVRFFIKFVCLGVFCFFLPFGGGSFFYRSFLIFD